MDVDCFKPKVFVVRLEGDNPKLSTALKLVRLGYATRISPHDIPKNSIVLNPLSTKVLTPQDRGLICRYGLVVIDTSWNTGVELIKKVGDSVKAQHRVLPALKAGNPINYGVLTKLSSVEAVAAALYIIGLRNYALELLNKFKWGPTFINLNLEYLERYSQARNEDEVLKIQEEILNKHLRVE